MRRSKDTNCCILMNAGTYNIKKTKMRNRAKVILEDEMSENTLAYMEKMDYLKEWVIDAMVNFHQSELNSADSKSVRFICNRCGKERGGNIDRCTCSGGDSFVVKIDYCADEQFVEFEGHTILMKNVVAVENVKAIGTGTAICDWKWGFVIKMVGNKIEIMVSEDGVMDRDKERIIANKKRDKFVSLWKSACITKIG